MLLGYMDILFCMDLKTILNASPLRVFFFERVFLPDK